MYINGYNIYILPFHYIIFKKIKIIEPNEITFYELILCAEPFLGNRISLILASSTVQFIFDQYELKRKAPNIRFH
jgi:hypothetical protein